MIDEKKLIAMTRMAAYEKNKGRGYFEIGKYFRSDYTSLHLLKGFVSGTISFGIIIALMLVYDLDLVVKDVYQTDILAFVKHWILVYLIFMGIYLAICYIVAAVKYSRARQGIKKYYIGLKQLLKYYE